MAHGNLRAARAATARDDPRAARARGRGSQFRSVSPDTCDTYQFNTIPVRGPPTTGRVPCVSPCGNEATLRLPVREQGKEGPPRLPARGRGVTSFFRREIRRRSPAR
ncbi:hypothetical protein GW17_00044293 [Ensete ventricosum]|nr:hypothetical protein GW17_00044293 [Ensete ventricosum]